MNFMKKDNHPGKFIVMEGLDGAGTETQSNFLFDYFKEQGKAVEKIEYPDYEGPIGKLIHRYLHEEYDFSVEVQFLLYFSDFVKDKNKIKKFLKEGKIVIGDRYFTTTIAYQGLRGFDKETALKLAEIFELPVPDLTVYLGVSPEKSIERKYGEKGSLDRNEKDKKFLERLVKSYQKIIKSPIFGEWVKVDGEKSIAKVSNKVKEVVLSKLNFNQIKEVK